MKLYNTLTRRKEEFVPQGDPIKMYVCGITPYAECHVGHAMSYIIFDVLRRYLEWRGHKVLHVQNFTDIDDKIIQRAASSGCSPQELAEALIQEYFNDMDAMNIQRAHIYPRATGEIDGIIEMIGGLVDKGHAYQVDGDVYFRVREYADYGKLSHRTPEGVMSGSRVEVDPRKEHPMDFALWKAAKPGEPSWESPWGAGRPGWHMECSAMSLKYLGATLDIHGGGQDLIFPHHENEIAQTEAYTGVTPFVRHWMHHGLLQLGEEKMSKSSGNLVTVKGVLSQYSPDALRLFVLGSHYRSPLTYSNEALGAMEKGAARLRTAIRGDTQEGSGASALQAEPFKQRFMEAMDDDFHTAQAETALFDLATEINRGKSEGAATQEATQVLVELCGVLGLTLKEEIFGERLDAAPFRDLLVSLEAELRKAGQEALAKAARDALDEVGVALEESGTGNKASGEDSGDSGVGQEPDPFIEALISVRAGLREAKEWKLADEVRAKLNDLGVALEDKSGGTVWKHRQQVTEL
ncbi:MAG: cysteine--tRNA ligase [Dehalococcoidia bacterium]